jgi:hypothetical protein
MAAALIQTYGAQAFTAVNGKGELQHHVRSHVCEGGVFVQIVDSNQDLSSRHRRRVVLGKYQPKDNLREVARDMLLMLVHSRRIDLDKPTDGVAWLLLCMDSPDNMTYNLFAFVFRSNDVDALMSSVAFCVGLALVLRSTHADARVTDLGPRLLVQMHPKSTETCAAFGLLLHESLLQSGAAALGASVNGVGLEVLADCAKLVNALESDAGLPAFARFGDRALSSVFTFCTVNNDCKGRLRHLSFTYMLSVLRGGYYNRAVAGEGGVAPLSAVGGSAIDGRLVAPVFSVSVRGASVLWHIACAVRPRTLNHIIARHGDCVEPMQLSYNHVRGFGRIGLESPPAPAPYAWWCIAQLCHSDRSTSGRLPLRRRSTAAERVSGRRGERHQLRHVRQQPGRETRVLGRLGRRERQSWHHLRYVQRSCHTPIWGRHHDSVVQRWLSFRQPARMHFRRQQAQRQGAPADGGHERSAER